MLSKKFHECECEWCDRNTENWNHNFCKYNNKWYCNKHYSQMKKLGKLINFEYHECFCEWCENNTNNYNGKFVHIDSKCYCSKHYQQLKNHGKFIDFIPMKYGQINDMPYGWASENELNDRIYHLWCGMFRRCYEEKYHETHPTYKECNVCKEWFYLSNFINDIKEINNYDKWISENNYQLDKDIKTNGKLKLYSKDNCLFVTEDENREQMLKTRDNEQFKGENNPFYGKKHSEESLKKMRNLKIKKENDTL